MSAWLEKRLAVLTPTRTAGLLAVLIPAVFLALRPIDDVDVFWQVRIGQLIVAEGFDLTEPLCYRQAGEPMSWLGWLGQVGLAAIHRAAGWEGVQAAHVILYAAALGLVWLRISRVRVGPGTGLVAALLIFLPCMTNCGERPQTFAFLAFSLLLFAGDARWSRLKYWMLVVPLLLIWQNVHPSLPVAVAVCGSRAVGRWADERWGRALGRGLWVRPLLTAIVAGGAVFCTPTGFAVLELGARNAEVSRWLGIGEWQPAHAMLRATAGFWFVLALGVLLWVRCRTRLAWQDLLPVLLLTGASLYWTRMIVFWALLSGPVLARLLEQARRTVFSHRRAAPFTAVGRPWRYGAVVVAAAALLTASPWVRPHVAWLPRSRRALFDPQLPFAGIDALGRTLDQGRIYNYREWGGILAFAGSPRWQIAIDGRIYRYDRSAWRSHVAVALGADQYRAVFDHDRPTALFLRPSHDYRLIERLKGDRDWSDHYSDPTCHIFIRREQAVAEARPAGRREVRLSASPSPQSPKGRRLAERPCRSSGEPLDGSSGG